MGREACRDTSLLRFIGGSGPPRSNQWTGSGPPRSNQWTVSCLWSAPGNFPDPQNLKLSHHNGRRQTSRRTSTRQRRVYHGHQKGCRARRLCMAVLLVPGRDGFPRVVPSKSLHGAGFDASECAHGGGPCQAFRLVAVEIKDLFGGH